MTEGFAMYEFILPDIGEGISEAVLIDWSVEVGQAIKEGDEVASVSTDKVDVELPSPRSGTVSELCWTPGDTVEVGSVFMRINTGNATPAKKAKIKTKKAAAPRRKKSSPDKSSGKASTKVAETIVAAPSTRKLAQDRGVNLSLVPGSGADGRILERDLNALSLSGDGKTREPLTPVRMAMAERMATSVHTLAHSTMNFEVSATGLRTQFETLKPTAVDAGVRLSPTVLLIKCLADTLPRHPRFNARIDERRRELLLHDDVSLSIAMATEKGLMVPVLGVANGKPLFDLAVAFEDLVTRCRSGNLKPADTKSGTFTLSNTGGLETATILSARPVINAPQTATLWVSRIQDRPVVADGTLSVGAVMNASLSFDHRFIDGADAVMFINDLTDSLEKTEFVIER
ncbi:MAG: 2-oxo acid dehydrogenase subunit E2 [Rhodospirillaceae bacterium]|jgi:pyruvate dehydrogenase E2 component (dihydrolipoamide acetyltransferase)|nr:2-oxo acid dehydrogenase subunit E2 [Rhodospirillaceae bacterium]MBT5297010.1 2-oxo acid dehydrogenase subunit E2 [Rhodospirillaceae bacterium]MBT6609587.1 2-oxo acid dehydrogenase subunit E2 [Rhodospirillaceae bacterium]MBT6883621.1 2-oxo acid dehydrogenase subunit E2 [Rhodospirillaceae bacterium]